MDCAEYSLLQAVGVLHSNPCCVDDLDLLGDRMKDRAFVSRVLGDRYVENETQRIQDEFDYLNDHWNALATMQTLIEFMRARGDRDESQQQQSGKWAENCGWNGTEKWARQWRRVISDKALKPQLAVLMRLKPVLKMQSVDTLIAVLVRVMHGHDAAADAFLATIASAEELAEFVQLILELGY